MEPLEEMADKEIIHPVIRDKMVFWEHRQVVEEMEEHLVLKEEILALATMMMALMVH